MATQTDFMRSNHERVSIVEDLQRCLIGITMTNGRKVGEWTVPFPSPEAVEAEIAAMGVSLATHRFVLVDSAEVVVES